MNNRIEQMELGMRNQIRNQPRSRREDRLKRARWWFNRMRAVVDLGFPSAREGQPRPEQTYFKLQQETFL